jgi:glycine C-acetyltransferase
LVCPVIRGLLRKLIELKKKYKFRLFIDDAHGFGVMGPRGEGTHIHQNCAEGVDIYFATFAKAMASIGAFVAGNKPIITHLRYNMRSQIFAKSLPLPLVIGDLKRLELIKRNTELKDMLWENVEKLQNGLIEKGFDIGKSNSCVTPVYLKGNIMEAANLVVDLRENYDIFCSMVIYPVIPKGEIILRIVSSSQHTDEDIEKTIYAFTQIKHKLENKLYDQEKVTFNISK